MLKLISNLIGRLFDAHIHEAIFVSEDETKAICRYCNKTYDYWPYHGYYPSFIVDFNMPKNDKRQIKEVRKDIQSNEQMDM